jgi:hypothetical protein
VTKTSASLNPPCNPSSANALQRRPAFEAEKTGPQAGQYSDPFSGQSRLSTWPGRFAVLASRFAAAKAAIMKIAGTQPVTPV